MTQEEKAKAYDEALERARKIHSKIVNEELLGFPGQIEDIFPELRKEEEPLTPFQQCLNCILRGVYYAEVPDEKVNEFILNVVRTRTDELIKLAKRHEYTDCQLRESEDERIRKGLIEALKTSKTVGELKFILPEPTREECIAYLEKQKGQKHPNGCFTCDEYKKGYEAGRLNGFTAGYNKAMKEIEQKEQKPLTAKEYHDKFDEMYGQYKPNLVEQKPAEKQDYSGLTDLERAIHRGFLAAGVENVPVGIIKETAKDCLVQTGLIRWELPEDFEDAVFNVVNFMSPFSSEEELREISHHFAEQLLSLAKEEIQKSTWSDDDENMLNEILENYKLRIYLGKSEIEWIESLKHRIQLQPQQEWSEEDERMLERAIHIIVEYSDIDEKESEIVQNWLKSLRPPFKDREMKLKILKYLSTRCSSLEFEEVEYYLNNLRPSWRPSEEQMEALKCAVEDVAKFSKRGGRQVELENEPYYSALHSLYCNLEKLM